MAKGAGGLVLFTPELELELDFNKLSMENIPVELGADDSMMSSETLKFKNLNFWNRRLRGKKFRPRLRFFPIGDDKKANDAHASLIGLKARFIPLKL